MRILQRHRDRIIIARNGNVLGLARFFRAIHRKRNLLHTNGLFELRSLGIGQRQNRNTRRNAIANWAFPPCRRRIVFIGRYRVPLIGRHGNRIGHRANFDRMSIRLLRTRIVCNRHDFAFTIRHFVARLRHNSMRHERHVFIDDCRIRKFVFYILFTIYKIFAIIIKLITCDFQIVQRLRLRRYGHSRRIATPRHDSHRFNITTILLRNTTCELERRLYLSSRRIIARRRIIASYTR